VSFRLSAAARVDLNDILDFSEARFGARAADRLEARFVTAFERIARGTAIGHMRRDIAANVPLRFVVERPFVIAFDPATREIVRILHGARNFGAIFGGG
jgi:plasmid stabilization system protein ParE